MKQRKLAPLLALALSLELMVSPVVGFAADTLMTSDSFSKVIQATGQVWGTVNQLRNNNGSGLSQQSAFDMQKLQEQQTPQTDKYFNPQKLGQIPGLGEYMALNNINPAMLDCKTLPTTLHEAKNEVCSIGVTTDRGVAPQAQLSEMQAYSNQYFQINKMYRNYTADSNSEGQLFGVGCMKNAMQILNGFFKYRLDELDKLTTNLEALNNQFRENSRADLDAIEESVAVLEGGDSELAAKVKSKRPDLFDYGKRFENAACTSMFSKDSYNKLGREKGLNSINQKLKDTLTEPNGKYSGESYSKSHTSVVEDLNNLADKVAKQAELRFSDLGDPKGYASFLQELPRSVSSTNSSNNALTSDLFSDVQTRFTEKSAKLQADFSTIANELKVGGADPTRALSIVKNLTTTNFESEVTTIENQLKNGCLKETLSGSSSIDTLLSKIYDPSASKYANEHASNFLKDKLQSIMSNEKTSPAKKLAELKALESQQGNRYYVKMENSYEVQETDANGNIVTRVVDASTTKSPSVFFSDIIRNCEAQFKVNKLDNQLSGQEAIQKLRSLHSSYKSLAKAHASEMKAEIKKKLIECASQDDANNTAVGSCTSERFNTGAPGFCANAALSCSKNMQACSEQSEKFVNEIKAQKTARVNNYKALVEKNKKDIVKIFDSALSRYMRDGEMLRGIFGAGFSSPSGIQREVQGDSKYLNLFTQATATSPDGRLLLEDPDKYVEMFKQNVTLLKKSVEDQQNQIVGGGLGKNNGLLADHIKQTEKNYKEVYQSAEKFADKCDRFYNEFVKAQETARNEQNKKNQELGEKRADFCNRYSDALQGNPGPACDGEVADTYSAASAADGGVAANRLRALCYKVNSGKERGDVSNIEVEAFKICRDPEIGDDGEKLCTEYKKCTEKKETTVRTKEDKDVVIKGEPACPQAEITALANEIVENYSETGSLQIEGQLPAYCAAADNSGRENSFSKALETFNQEMIKSRAGAQ